MTSLMHDYWDDDVRMELRQQPHSPFYCHPYGGIGRDIRVTREGFARFFEIDPNEVSWMQANMKIIDVMLPMSELLGYKLMNLDGKEEYSITIVEHSHSRVSDLLAIAPYLWEGTDGVRSTVQD